MTYTSDLHVLIVAADPVERVTIADLVSSQNWSTIMVNDGDAAITHARIEPYHAIVIRSNSTDCEMINCVAEAREKAAPTSPNNATPVLLLVNRINAQDNEASADLGRIELAEYPISAEGLRFVLRSLTARAPSQRQSPLQSA